MSAPIKPAVLNPLTLRNNVGSELALMLEQRGIMDYNERLGIKDLRLKENLSNSILRKLKSIFGEEYEDVVVFLENFQKDYLDEKKRCQTAFKEAKKDFSRLKKSLILLKGEFCEGYDLLDDIIDFFGVENTAEIFRNSTMQEAMYRRNNRISVDPVNLYAWLRRGELDFKSMNLGKYNKEALLYWINDKDWLNFVNDVKYFKQLPEILNKFGVALSLVPYLSKTVYGAVRWIDDLPLIEISDREHDLAVCWFTLFHELGHIILHQNYDVYDDDINYSPLVPREKEANKFANQYLFNGDNLRKSIFARRNHSQIMRAEDIAQEFNVQPIFASYWLRKSGDRTQPHTSIRFMDSYQPFHPCRVQY